MNILPKKSWHVRTKANIERVRKDEEKAAEEERERQRRIALAEQEARTDLLRKRASQRHAINEEPQASSSAVDDKPHSFTSPGKELDITSLDGRHINFFKGIEEAERHGNNKEYEEEKKAEKEKQEKAIGLLTYLGQSATEAQTAKPWYFKMPEKKSKPEDSKSSKRIRDEEFDLKQKSKLDPMNDMMRYLEKKRKASGKTDDYIDYGKPKKRHKNSKDRERSKSAGSSSSGGTKTIEMLRAERLRREKEERLKQERLLAKVRGEKLPEENPEPVVDDRSRRYNQQYNPDLARRPKRKDCDDYMH